MRGIGAGAGATRVRGVGRRRAVEEERRCLNMRTILLRIFLGRNF